MANYEEARGKLTNTQLCKLRSAAKNNTGTTLRTTKKTFKMKNYHMYYFQQQYRKLMEELPSLTICRGI